MKIFITGGTGFVGTVVVEELIAEGHIVTGLARSEKSASQLLSAGAEVLRGDLEDIKSLKEGAKQADGVLHLGFIHDFTNFKAVCEIDKLAILALGEALEGTEKPLVVTAGTAMISPGYIAKETDKAMKSSDEYPRMSEETVDILIARGINASIVRLSPSVHGKGDYGFIPFIIDIAKKKGISAYIDTGKNRWSAVHRKDAAKLFRLAIESSKKGSRYHGASEEEIPFISIAEKIAEKLNIPMKEISQTEANNHFGWLAGFAGMDCPASSKKTKDQLGWKPLEINLIEDLDKNYF